MATIDFESIFAGTLHIWIYYMLILFIVIFLLGVSRHITKLFENLNKIHIVKTHPLFKLNYGAIALLIGIIIASIVIIGYKEFRWIDFTHFQIFAGFAFSVMPFSIGVLSVYFYIIRNREYHLGNVLLLVISFVSFCMVGTNLHDVIWCAVVTNGYTVEAIGGRDLESFFAFFQFYDPSRWDYRTFGMFMIVRVCIEISVGILALHKFFRLNQKFDNRITARKKWLEFLLLISVSILFGIVQFVFDYPWAFSDLEYNINVYIGIPLVAVLYILCGISLSLRSF